MGVSCVRPAVTFPGHFQFPWGERKLGFQPEMGEEGAAVLPEGEVSLETEAGGEPGLWTFTPAGIQESSLLTVISGNNSSFI